MSDRETGATRAGAARAATRTRAQDQAGRAEAGADALAWAVVARVALPSGRARPEARALHHALFPRVTGLLARAVRPDAGGVRARYLFASEPAAAAFRRARPGTLPSGPARHRCRTAGLRGGGADHGHRARNHRRAAALGQHGSVRSPRPAPRPVDGRRGERGRHRRRTGAPSGGRRVRLARPGRRARRPARRGRTRGLPSRAARCAGPEPAGPRRPPGSAAEAAGEDPGELPAAALPAAAVPGRHRRTPAPRPARHRGQHGAGLDPSGVRQHPGPARLAPAGLAPAAAAGLAARARRRSVPDRVPPVGGRHGSGTGQPCRRAARHPLGGSRLRRAERGSGPDDPVAGA